MRPVNFFLTVFFCLCSTSPVSAGRQVVVYTSVDQIFSEPILELFEQRTGITVKAVYDVEASKTVGLVNRLIAEAKRPRADVFWNSEVIRTIVLQNKNVLVPYISGYSSDIPDQFKDREGYWTGFACRARVIAYNTKLLSPDELPVSIFDLTSEKWRGKAAMANPLFGTTATHTGALFADLGAEKAKQFLRDLKKNGVLFVSGNSQVRSVVAAGEVPLGITDVDDVMVAVRQGKPIAMIYPDQGGMGTFVIPNTVALVRGGPNPAAGRKLIDFLLSPEVEEILARSESSNMPVRAWIKGPDGLPSLSSLDIMHVDYRDAADSLQESDRFCRRLMAR